MIEKRPARELKELYKTLLKNATNKIPDENPVYAGPYEEIQNYFRTSPEIFYLLIVTLGI
jgi:hypothetical protein